MRASDGQQSLGSETESAKEGELEAESAGFYGCGSLEPESLPGLGLQLHHRRGSPPRSTLKRGRLSHSTKKTSALGCRARQVAT